MTPVEMFAGGVVLFLVGAVCLVLIRLVRGPHMADRVISLDLITTLGIGIIATFSIMNDAPVFVDVLVVIALVAFLGTVAFAYYLQRKADDDQ